MGSCTSKDTSTTGASLNTTLDKRAAQSAKLNADGGTELNGHKAEVAAAPNGNGAETANGSGAILESNKDVAKNVGLSRTNDKEVKILLLGSGESGKSTIVKQMKILHKDGFSKQEAYDYKPFVFKNVLDCVHNIIQAVLDLAPELVIRPENAVDESLEKQPLFSIADLNAILEYDISVNTDTPFDPEIAGKIREFYSHPELHEFIKHNQGKFHLIDSSDYFLSAIERIAEPQYMPTQADILRTRKKTSGIFDFKFQLGSTNVHMFDVGGQRSERKKWIHCFDNVTLIIFCVALSEYDQVLLEENTQNRLQESLNLFDSVVNSRWFSRTSIVLFLNKIDVFANKLPYSPIEAHFPDYNGGDNLNKAIKYILWKFTQVNRSGLNIYPHVTQATDTSNIELVFAALKETILENTLRDSGIL